MNSIRFAAYWGSRPSSCNEISRTVVLLLASLGKVNALFREWYRVGHSLAEARASRIALTEESIYRLLLAGQSKTDMGGELMPELGFSMEVWNGRVRDGGTNFSLLAGATAPRISNCCVLSIQADEVLLQQLTCSASVRQLLVPLVWSWAPDHAILSTSLLDDTLQDKDITAKMGWVTYVKRNHINFPALQASDFLVTSLDNSDGCLVWVVREDQAVGGPDQLSRAVTLAKLLSPHGQ